MNVFSLLEDGSLYCSAAKFTGNVRFTEDVKMGNRNIKDIINTQIKNRLYFCDDLFIGVSFYDTSTSMYSFEYLPLITSIFQESDDVLLLHHNAAPSSTEEGNFNGARAKYSYKLTSPNSLQTLDSNMEGQGDGIFKIYDQNSSNSRNVGYDDGGIYIEVESNDSYPILQIGMSETRNIKSIVFQLTGFAFENVEDVYNRLTIPSSWENKIKINYAVLGTGYPTLSISAIEDYVTWPQDFVLELRLYTN